MFSSLCHTILFRSLSLTLQAAPRLWATSLSKKTCLPLSYYDTAQGDSRLVSCPGFFLGFGGFFTGPLAQMCLLLVLGKQSTPISPSVTLLQSVLKVMGHGQMQRTP